MKLNDTLVTATASKINYLTNSSNSNNSANSAIVTDTTGNVRLGGGFLEITGGKLMLSNNNMEVTNGKFIVTNNNCEVNNGKLIISGANFELSNGNAIITHGNITTNQDINSERLFVNGISTFSNSILPNAAETIDIGSEALPFRSIYVSKNTINFIDSTAGQSASLSVDTSTGGISTSSGSGVSATAITLQDGLVNIQGDISASRLFVHNDVSLNGNLYIGGDLSWNPNNIPTASIPSEAVIGGNSGSGSTGPTGATGPQGEKGDTGSNGADGATGPQGEKGEPPTARSYSVTAAGGYYYIDGVQQDSLHLIRGQTYIFNLNVSGHPFFIQTSSTSYNSANVYNSGVTNNGATTGSLTITVPYDAPNTLYYVCQYHSGMGGSIEIVNLSGDGLKGEKGDTGSNGADGPTGAQGVKGDTGASGNFDGSNDLTLGNRMFVANDVSFNKNLYVKENLIVDGNVSLKQYNNEYIVNTHTTNYDLIVAEDLSVNGNLFINNDTSLNGDLYVAGSIAGTLTTPAQSNITSVGTLTSLALSGHITPNAHGTINIGTDSLKFNEIHGVTASLNTINVGGDLSLNNRLFVGGDVSLAGNLLPSAANTYSLGSSTYPFASVYVYQSSIHFIDGDNNDNIISIDSDEGTIDINKRDSGGNQIGARKKAIYMINKKVGINVRSVQAEYNLDVSGTMQVSEDASLNRLFVPSIIVHNDISFAPNVGVVHQF